MGSTDPSEVGEATLADLCFSDIWNGQHIIWYLVSDI